MKIILSAYACRPFTGSEPGNGWNWCQHLAEAGHEIWLVTTSCVKEELAEACAKYPNIHLHFVEEPQLPLGLSKLAARRLDYFSWQKAILPVARAIVSSNSIDLVHHVTYGSLHGGSQLWKLPVPFIFGPVGGGQKVPWKFFRYYWQGGWYEMVRSLMTQALCLFPPAVQPVRNAALTLATNSDTASLIVKMGGKRPRLFMDSGIPSGNISNTFPRRRQTGGAFKLLWVGQLIPRKAVLLALEALSRVSTSVSVKLSVLGSGPQAALIPKWMDQLGLNGRVELLGLVPWAEVKKVYLEHDALLFTSLRDSMGNQNLEAMLQAMPIICLDHQGVHDLVTDETGIKVPVSTPANTALALAQAIEKLARNPGLCARIGRRAWERAAGYSWPERALAMTKIYEQVIETYRNRRDTEE